MYICATDIQKTYSAILFRRALSPIKLMLYVSLLFMLPT